MAFLFGVVVAACGGSTVAPPDAQGDAVAPDVSADDAADGAMPDARPDVAVPDVAPDVAVTDVAPDVAVMDVAPDVAVTDVTPDAMPDAPRPDAPSPDAPSPDAPSPDVPSLDAPRPDVPSPDVPTLDAPRPDVPSPDAPSLDAPRPDAPSLDAPRPDATSSCDGGLTSCGGACVNVMSDRNHCGACGMSCCGGALCLNGRCFPDCPPGRTPCVLPGATCHVCVDFRDDPSHCGACNRACAAGQVCANGQCRCPAVTEAPSPMGVCDGRGRIACQMWAQGLAGGNPNAVATCLVSPSGCARADSCADVRDPSTCRCGASPACGVGQVCVLSGPTARCVCATP